MDGSETGEIKPGIYCYGAKPKNTGSRGNALSQGLEPHG